MKTIILGTSGHIDHGKTTLVKALTGIDTDRLKEEKQRGITIELGFAPLKLDDSIQVGIVDVPGHERFVRHMVAGAAGMDIVCMVIAADEGVMPQTREHLDICQLLNVQQGMVVVTKSDLVDDEFLELVTEDIADCVKGTFLENAPIIPCSSRTGQGIPDVLSKLRDFCQTATPKNIANLFRLPIDRVFSMKGFGAVVTGTQLSGQVCTGDRVMVYPSKKTAKVRGLQSHQNKLEISHAGMRCAVNLQGIDRSEINRGDVLSHLNCLQPTYMIDIHFKYLKNNERPLTFRSKIRFHTGTSEIPAHVFLLDRENLLPGESTFAQIRFEKPLCVMRGDRFVLRQYSPVQTIGGGFVIHPLAPKRKRFKEEILKDMERLGNADDLECLIIHIQKSGFSGITLSRLTQCTALEDSSIKKYLQELTTKKSILLLDSEPIRYIHKNTVTTWKNRICERLQSYHKAFPHKTGMPRQELKSRFPESFPSALFQVLLDDLVSANLIQMLQEFVAMTNHQPALSNEMIQKKETVYDIIKKSGLAPPLLKDLSRHCNLEQKQVETLLTFLDNEKCIVRISQEIAVCIKVFEKLENQLIEYLKTNESITTKDFKNMTQVSRKYSIPFLEYFDRKKITLRVDDVRKLRKK
ncbi:selenocysteine-specific translation elongation factor [Candidatus Magnetomorum sp. HK-1]|nr:selenocysteine-specific translation elongation factor [Candidatus Magnetomorum sp. HK-1]